MITISRLTSLTLVTALAAGLAGCMHIEDSATQYVQRSDKVTLSAGNANEANLAIQTVDPWPRASADRRIPANGERMAGAYERYRNVDKVATRPIIQPPILAPNIGGAAGASTPAK